MLILPAVYEKLLSLNKTSSLFKWKQNRMQYSMGLFVYYFGTKKTYPGVEHHTIKFGDKYKEHLSDIFDNKKLNDDISYYLHRPSATDKSMAPEGNDCFYVLVPVPNNQSKIDWKIEGEKMKNLVIDKMEKALLPNLRENIIEDFYLTPDYFENELNTKFGSGFSIQPKFHSLHILGFIINQKFMMVCILLGLEHILVQVFLECYPQQKF